jgi:hypothetical protein
MLCNIYNFSYLSAKVAEISYISKTLLPIFPLNNNFHPNMVTHQLIPWENTVHAQVPSFKFQMDFEKWIFRGFGYESEIGDARK